MLLKLFFGAHISLEKNKEHIHAFQKLQSHLLEKYEGIERELVEAGKYEAVYGNMPIFGLAASTNHVSATGRRETARRRLGGQNEPAIASPPTESEL